MSVHICVVSRRALRLAVLVVLSLVVALAVPAAARAESGVLLCFGASYTGPDGASRIHRGVDVSGDAGEHVRAFAAGTVTFVGRVPSAEGGTMLAVTLDTSHGSLTLMPLASASVSRGESVSSGGSVGMLAADGDASSPAAHLHVGLKRAGLYLDPAFLLAAPAPATSPEPVEVAVPVAAAPAAASGSAVSAPSLAPGVGLAPVESPAGQPSAGQVAAQAAPHGAEAVQMQAAPGGTLAPGVTLAGASGSAVAVAGSASRAPATRPAPGARVAALARGASAVPSATLYLSIALTLVCGTSLIVGMRVFSLRVASCPPVSDRLGRMLQHLRTGDTLRGLTSCSGPLPSQSRGH